MSQPNSRAETSAAPESHAEAEVRAPLRAWDETFTSNFEG